MKKLNRSLILFLLLFSVKISKADGKDTLGVFMTTQNETVYLFDKVSTDGFYITYYDAKNKGRNYAMQKIKWMKIGDHFYCAYPIKRDRGYRLLEIIAMNKKYILATRAIPREQRYYGEFTTYVYIFDYESNPVEQGLLLPGTKKGIRKFYEQISPYFKDCTELMKKFQDNLDKGFPCILNLYAEQCDGAPDINDFILNYKDKRNELKKK